MQRSPILSQGFQPFRPVPMGSETDPPSIHHFRDLRSEAAAAKAEDALPRFSSTKNLAGQILFDERTRTFRLYSKSTLYAFRADEGGNLEHLFWGNSVPPEDDLRYLAFSNVQLCFDPGPSNYFEDTTAIEDLMAPPVGLIAGESMGDHLLQEWDQARKQQSGVANTVGDFGDIAPALLGDQLAVLPSMDDEGLNAARRENAAWRLMKMHEMKAAKESAGEELDDGELAALVELAALEDAAREEQDLESIPESHNYHPKSPSLRAQAQFAKVQAFAEGFVPGFQPVDDAPLPPDEGDYRGRRSRGVSIATTPLITPHGHGMDEDERWEASLPNVGRNTKLLEWADAGTGDFRPPSFGVHYEDGSTICPLSYQGHTITKGKKMMDKANGRLPELRGGENDCMTLVVEMVDKLTGLEFNLVYTVYKKVDALVRRTIVKNPSGVPTDLSKSNPNTKASKMQQTTSGTKRIHRLMSATVDFHTMSAPRLVTLSGSWANERHLNTQFMTQGKFVCESLRGTSSHQHNPFMALTNASEDQLETSGDVWGFNLVYSGNFMVECEVAETGRTRINAGVNPNSFRWHLPSGDAFESPECVLVYSARGLETMSHEFHDLYRNYLIADRWLGKIPSVLLNTWEAMYFDVSHAKVLELAKAAQSAGVEMIVLDDGWFGEREDATSSLGDWYEDSRKFPEGLPGLVREVNALGMEFGIWVEPEMVNVKSALYKKHPAWCLNQQGRNFRCEGRNQLVLDFSRAEVQKYVEEKLEALLSSSNIEYLKWDMNRHLTEVYGNNVAAEKQGEVFHRYMVGVYKVLRFLNAKFPNVRIETCSGGGGRFDPGMLHYSPQVWTSDNTDVFSRMAIQSGTSLIYPLSSMGSHITSVPNHQTQRLSTLKTRFLVAIFGTFGLELDIRRLSQQEFKEVSEYIAKFKELAPTIHEGKFYRLWAPSRNSDRFAYAWMCFHHTNAIAAVVAVFLTKTEPGKYLPRLCLRGLNEDETYVVEEIFPNTSRRNTNTGQIEVGAGPPQWQLGREMLVMSGKSLMMAGLPIRLSYDGDSCAFVLHRTNVIAHRQALQRVPSNLHYLPHSASAASLTASSAHAGAAH